MTTEVGVGEASSGGAGVGEGANAGVEVGGQGVGGGTVPGGTVGRGVNCTPTPNAAAPRPGSPTTSRPARKPIITNHRSALFSIVLPPKSVTKLTRLQIPPTV